MQSYSSLKFRKNVYARNSERTPLPLPTMTQFAEPVIPDESALVDEIRKPVRIQYNQIISRSRLASRFAGLGRDDESRNSLLKGEGGCGDQAELNK
jgi:hypothetical protein